MTDSIVIAAFYHFAPLENYEAMKMPLLAFCNDHKLKGTVLLAAEGINSTISGTREAMDAFLAHLKSDPRLADLEWKESYLDHQPFERMKVRLKKEIVRLGVEDLNIANRGHYVEPKDWDALIANEDVAVIDTRNEYEIRIGTFAGAVNPDTETFRQFPEWAKNWAQDKVKATQKVAMFCTGGIRCEKSTALMKQLGFEHVYHLKGGILKYLEETQNKNGQWQGECFVFDERTAVNETLKPTGAVLCEDCGAPVTAEDLKYGHKGQVLCRKCI
jgi:UPF0176 protein